MHRSLRLNIAAGFLGMLWICAPLGAPLPLLMQAVHASSTQLGLLSAAWQAAMLAQIPAAFFAEGLAKRKKMWAVVSILHRLLWLSPALVPWLLPNHADWWPVMLILLLALSNLLANLGTASWSSWMADIIPPDTAGHFWSVRQRLLSIGLILGTACYGFILDRWSPGGVLLGFQWVFGLCGFFGVLDILVHCFVHEPQPVKVEIGTSFRERLATPFRLSGFLLVSVLIGVWNGAQAIVGYTLAMPGFFSMVHLRDAFGASYSQASFTFIFAALGGAVFCGLLGPWIDRSGALSVLTRLIVWTPFSMMVWWFAKPGVIEIGGASMPSAVCLMSVAALFQGALCTGTLLCQFRLSQIYTPASGRTMAMALHGSIVGIGGALGGLGGGWFTDWLKGFGNLPFQRYPFDFLVMVHVLLAWGVALPLCRRIFALSFPSPGGEPAAHSLPK